MKKTFLGMIFVLGINLLYAQTIDRTQYEEMTLFDYGIWSNNATSGTIKKIKATVLFRMQSLGSAGYHFVDLDETNGTTININKRFSAMERNQKVTIYFTVKASGYGRLMDSCILDDIDYNNATEVKPWEAFIDDGKPGKNGWYLRPLGNGRYEEVHY
jgi:hypothetical protein